MHALTSAAESEPSLMYSTAGIAVVSCRCWSSTLLPLLKEWGYVYTGVCLSVCLSVRLFAGLLKKLREDFVEIFWRDGAWPKEQ